MSRSLKVRDEVASFIAEELVVRVAIEWSQNHFSSPSPRQKASRRPNRTSSGIDPSFAAHEKASCADSGSGGRDRPSIELTAGAANLSRVAV